MTGLEQALLDAAAKLFDERGFKGVNIDQIGAEAGVTGPALYRYFSSKQEILATLIDQGLDRFVEQLGPPLEDPFEEIADLARMHASLVIEDRTLGSLYTREERSLPDSDRRRFHRRQMQYVGRWVQVLKRCYPHVSEELLAVVAHGSIGQLNSVAFWPDSALAVDGLPDLMAGMVVDGIRALEVHATHEG